jgi:hypothetical protein
MSLTIFCENLFGALDADCQARLQAVMDNPTPETWDNAYSLIIGGRNFRTLWQAVLIIDPTYLTSGTPVKIGETITPEQKWSRVPSKETIRAAIKLVAEKNLDSKKDLQN